MDAAERDGAGGVARYRKVPIRRFPPRAQRETAESKYWRAYKAPQLLPQHGNVTSVDFSPVAPYDCAATAGLRVHVIDGKTRKVKRTIGRFKDVAYSAVWRSDGLALAAGCASGVVQLFDASSRTVLRQFHGHKGSCRAVAFGPDRLRLLSGSDDATARWWDVTAGEEALRLVGHTDYVRACAGSPASDSLWATGSYDHTVRLWDVRASGKEAAAVMDHGYPVESVCFFPGGTLVAAAGGPCVTVWDVVGGGRLLRRLRNFQKTATCVRVYGDVGPPAAGGGLGAEGGGGGGGPEAPRLLAGSLDGHVRVYELDRYRTTHSARYPAPVLSLGLAEDASTLAVGMASNLLSVRRRLKPRVAAGGPAGGGGGAPRGAPVGTRRVWRPDASSYRYFLRGKSERAAEGDFRVAQRRRAHLAAHDRLLRRFRYREALDAALASSRPEVVVSVLEELAARGGLSSALAGRDAQGLLPVLGFLRQRVAEPRHTKLLVSVAHRALDIYGGSVGEAPEVDAALVQLRERVAQEAKLQVALAAVQGLLEPVLAAGRG